MAVNVEQMIKRLEQVGGYIYPSVDKLSDGSELTHFGMTLRDYFAGQALANMAGFHAGDAFDPKNVSKAAYHYADAMLQARSKSDE